jgi:hypothetical protein
VIVGLGVGVKVTVGVGVGLLVGVSVGVGVAVAVLVSVGVTVKVLVGVGVTVDVDVGVGVGGMTSGAGFESKVPVPAATKLRRKFPKMARAGVIEVKLKASDRSVVLLKSTKSDPKTTTLPGVDPENVPDDPPQLPLKFPV